MSEKQLNETVGFAEQTARQAGELLLGHYSNLVPEEIEHKGDINLVTRADVESERLIVSAIRKKFPGHSIGAEEEVNDSPGSCHWLVDPLDGTTNFAHSLPMFAVSMAYIEDSVTKAAVVHIPCLGETFTAVLGNGAFLNKKPISVSSRDDLRQSVLATGFHYERRTQKDNNIDTFCRFILDVQGLRRMGSAAIDLSYVACGRFDAFWEPHLAKHDVAAGALIVKEAGGMVTDYLGGTDYLAMRRIVATNGRLHDKVMERLEIIV